MGAEFESHKVKALTKVELKASYEALVESALYDHGHSGYTGSIAESPGLTISDKEFDSPKQAEDYIDATAKKWENSLAVKIRNTDYWVIGGIYSS